MLSVISHPCFIPLKSRQILKKHFSCFRFVLKNFMQNLPKKRESVFPRPPNIECMRYTSKCPHDAEYPRVKRNQLLTLSGFFRARIRNQDDTWRRSWAIVGAKIAVKVGPSFCNLASFKRRNLFKRKIFIRRNIFPSPPLKLPPAGLDGALMLRNTTASVWDIKMNKQVQSKSRGLQCCQDRRVG